MDARAIRLACLRAVMAQPWPAGTTAAFLLALAEQMAERALAARLIPAKGAA